jgi:hypothetical protein
MKSILNFLILMLWTTATLADQSMTFDSSRVSLGKIAKHTYTLPKQRKLIVSLKPNPGHMAFNRLSLKLHCLKKNTVLDVYDIKIMCGLQGLDYHASSDSVVLHLTKYNSASLLGDCSGAVYSETVSLAGFCSDKKQKKNDQEAREKKEDLDKASPEHLAQ